jgi:6-phosphofructokinase
MPTPSRRIAINFGGGFVPGLNAVIAGASRAAHELGWEVIGIRDGFDGLIFPERYGDTALIPIQGDVFERLSNSASDALGTADRSDPFNVRIEDDNGILSEQDRSGELLKAISHHRIDAVVSIVGQRSLSILWKLANKGLNTVAVPKSIYNDMAATDLTFGFDSALAFATEALDRARLAAKATRQIAVVEVPGYHAGWLALQSGTAACADAILIPEINYDIKKVADRLRLNAQSGATSALIVVAEGAKPLTGQEKASAATSEDAYRSSLSPSASGQSGSQVINRSGHAAKTVALDLQRLTHQETSPLVLGNLVRCGAPTAADRQLGLSYGAAAIRAIEMEKSGVMVSFQPPELEFVPLMSCINRVRTVPTDSVFMQVARALGISLGD